jgi:hypothetical protein
MEPQRLLGKMGFGDISQTSYKMLLDKTKNARLQTILNTMMHNLKFN